MNDSQVIDYVLKSVVGGALVLLLGYFIYQITTGVWITRREYDAVVAMKDAQIAKLEAEVSRLESRFEQVEKPLRESASALNQVLGAAIGRTATPNG